MTVELAAIAPDAQAVLQQAAIAYRTGSRDRPKPEILVNALLQAEKAAKQQRFTYPLEPLLGQWRLAFATGTRKLRQRGGITLGKGFYLPRFTFAAIGFHPVESPSSQDSAGLAPSAPLEISNQIQVGGLKLKFTGPARYLGKKNLLAFDFTQVQLSGGDRSLYRGSFRSGKSKAAPFDQQPIAKLPFFAFFQVTEDFIAARGRGGGLALWIRTEETTRPAELA